MNKHEEAEFEIELQSAIEKVKEFDYRPRRFIQAIAAKGPFRTVKDIVASGKPSDGFEKLVLNGRTNLTCEAIIVETRWRKFFDDDLLKIAEDRLTRHNYKWFAFAAPDEETKNSPGTAPSVTTDVDDFVPPPEDQREKKLREVYERQGQSEFRTRLIDTYGAKCIQA